MTRAGLLAQQAREAAAIVLERGGSEMALAWPKHGVSSVDAAETW